MTKSIDRKSPKVSVIIPTYNRAELVVKAVNSVLAQTFADFECIVIDDGSTDETLMRLQEIDDCRLKVLTRRNGGVSAARNQAVSSSSGEFIALLDSDDEWVEDKLEKQISFMVEEELQISQTDEIWIRKGRRVNQCKKHEKPEGFFFRRSLEMCMISPSCVMFTREFWDDVGPFDESMPACEDYDLWIRAGLKYPVGLLRERLTVKHGGRPDQLSCSVGCLDLYRMYAMAKLLVGKELDAENKKLVFAELKRKSAFYVGGCRKRGREAEAERVDRLLQMTEQGRLVDPAEFIGN